MLISYKYKRAFRDRNLSTNYGAERNITEYLLCDNRITKVNKKLYEHFFCVDASEISSNISLVPQGAWGVGKKVFEKWWKVDKEKAHFPRPIVPVLSLLVSDKSFCFISWKPFWWRELKNEVERKNSTELVIFTMLREPLRLAPNGTVH